MYAMGLDIHYFGVIVLMAVVLFNIVMLALSQQIVRYAKRMRIVMPISATLITLVVFTGMVMMAAKHLSFTASNVAMIVISIVLIVLETRRYKILKRRTDIALEGAFVQYKAKVFPMLGMQMVLMIAMSVWMMLL